MFDDFDIPTKQKIVKKSKSKRLMDYDLDSPTDRKLHKNGYKKSKGCLQ